MDLMARQLRITWGLACLTWLLVVAAASAGAPVLTRELLLFNRLDEPRVKELVAVSLRDLGVSPEQERHIEDAETIDASGKSVTCQYDPFGQIDGFRSEVSFLVDLEPYERRTLTVRFLSKKRPPTGIKPLLKAEAGPKEVTITAPEFAALVSWQPDGLWLRRVVLAKSEAETDEALFGDPTEDGEPTDTIPALRVGDSKVDVPFADGGLPFAFQGMPPASKNVETRVFTGPVRVAVGLFDRGPWRGRRVLSRQTLSVPGHGRVCHLTCEMLPQEKLGRGGIGFGGLRVATPEHIWDMRLGQKDAYVGRASPVKITLIGKKGSIFIYPPYLHSTFNHVTGRVACEAAWAGVAVDRTNTNLGKFVDRVSGKRQLPSRLAFEDAGLYGNSLQPKVGWRNLAPGVARTVRAALWFGGAEEPGDMDPRGRHLNSAIFVPHLQADPPASLDATRFAKLVTERPVVVVRPDVLGRDGDAFWQELARRIGGVVISTASFRRYAHWIGGGPPVLAVVVGEPGEHELLDEFLERTPFLNRYPLADDRFGILLSEAKDEMWRRIQGEGAEGAALLVAGSTRAATRRAVDELIATVADRVPPLPPVAVAAREWTTRVPLPWLGIRARDHVSSAVAFRNGRSEHLLLICANRDVGRLRVSMPEQWQVWHTRWRYFNHIIPASDAALPGLPGALAEGEQIGLWLSAKIPPDAEPGVREDKVALFFDDHRHEVALRTEVLSLALPDKYAFGFRPMYAGKRKFRFYLGCKDDEDYYRKLPRALRQAGAFGVNYYTLDLSAMKVQQDKQGRLSIDTREFKRELDAVRAAGTVDVILVSSTHRVLGLGTIRGEDPLAVFRQQDRRIALLRETLRTLGVEDELYCCYNDEIQDYELWLYHARRLKRAGLKLNVCVNGYGVWNKHLAVGTMDMWTPQYPIYMTGKGTGPFNREFRDARLADGNVIWPYVCGSGPYASSSRPRSQARFLIVDLYLKGAHGLTYYGGFGWPMSGGHRCPGFVPGQPYDLITSGLTFEVLFYPHTETASILPSLRAASFRMGIEDATAADALRWMARKRGVGEQLEAELAAAHAKLDRDSEQSVFDEFRRGLDRMHRRLEE